MVISPVSLYLHVKLAVRVSFFLQSTASHRGLLLPFFLVLGPLSGRVAKLAPCLAEEGVRGDLCPFGEARTRGALQEEMVRESLPRRLLRMRRCKPRAGEDLIVRGYKVQSRAHGRS